MKLNEEVKHFNSKLYGTFWVPCVWRKVEDPSKSVEITLVGLAFQALQGTEQINL